MIGYTQSASCEFWCNQIFHGKTLNSCITCTSILYGMLWGSVPDILLHSYSKLKYPYSNCKRGPCSQSKESGCAYSIFQSCAPIPYLQSVKRIWLCIYHIPKLCTHPLLTVSQKNLVVHMAYSKVVHPSLAYSQSKESGCAYSTFQSCAPIPYLQSVKRIWLCIAYPKVVHPSHTWFRLYCILYFHL